MTRLSQFNSDEEINSLQDEEDTCTTQDEVGDLHIIPTEANHQKHYMSTNGEWTQGALFAASLATTCGTVEIKEDHVSLAIALQTSRRIRTEKKNPKLKLQMRY